LDFNLDAWLTACDRWQAVIYFTLTEQEASISLYTKKLIDKKLLDFIKQQTSIRAQ